MRFFYNFRIDPKPFDKGRLDVRTSNPAVINKLIHYSISINYIDLVKKSLVFCESKNPRMSVFSIRGEAGGALIY
jgi:hypothetical protein